ALPIYVDRALVVVHVATARPGRRTVARAWVVVADHGAMMDHPHRRAVGARVRVAVGIAVVTAVVATVVAMVPPVLAVLAARLPMVAVVPAAFVAIVATAVVVAVAVASAPVVVGHGNGGGGGGRQRQHQGGAPPGSAVHGSPALPRAS